MNTGHVRVTAPLTYGVGEESRQRTPEAIATVSLRGPRGGFIGAEEVDIAAARAAHKALGDLIAAHDAQTGA